MNSDPKKMMKEIEDTAFWKPSSRSETRDFVEKGGMDKYILVDGEYREIDDTDGVKLEKQKRFSTRFLGTLVAVLITAGVVLCVMTMNGFFS